MTCASDHNSTTVILCSAGFGVRLGKGVPKALVTIAGRPLFTYSLNTIGRQESVNNILILAPNGFIDTFHKEIKKHTSDSVSKKIVGIISGGDERQESIMKGLEHLHQLEMDERSIVLIHNAANPFVAKDDIDRVRKAIVDGFASAVALPSTDTLRVLDDTMRPVSKLERRTIWRMQTPQGSTLSNLYKAYAKARDDGYQATDDIELVGRLGMPVKVVESSKLNFKVTYVEDLALTEAIVQYRSKN